MFFSTKIFFSKGPPFFKIFPKFQISTDPSVEFFSFLSGPLLRYKLLRIGPSLELLATMWWTTVAASIVGDQPQPRTHNSPL